jgi:hypothetical protein
MRLIKVEWGRFKLEVPGEVFLLLAFKAASLLFHNVNV